MNSISILKDYCLATFIDNMNYVEELVINGGTEFELEKLLKYLISKKNKINPHDNGFEIKLKSITDSEQKTLNQIMDFRIKIVMKYPPGFPDMTIFGVISSTLLKGDINTKEGTMRIRVTDDFAKYIRSI